MGGARGALHPRAEPAGAAAARARRRTARRRCLRGGEAAIRLLRERLPGLHAALWHVRRALYVPRLGVPLLAHRLGGRDVHRNAGGAGGSQKGAGMTAIAAAERLIVALDVPSAKDAKALVEKLGDAARFYKVGLELFSA